MSDKYCHIAKERVARDIEKKLNNINTSKQEFLFNP
jgi:hypothetical protein